MKKIISAISLALCALLCCGLLAACGGGDDSGLTGGGKNTFTFEAEYTDLDGLTGGGISNSAEGVNMIMGTGSQADKDKGWGEGFFVGYTYAAGLTFTFEIKSDKAADAKIILRLGSEIGDITLDSSIFSVIVNGEELTYSDMYIANSLIDEAKFYDKAINDGFTLKEGDNVIQLRVNANTIRGSQQGGPLIDSIKISTDANLTWTPKTENVSGFVI